MWSIASRFTGAWNCIRPGRCSRCSPPRCCCSRCSPPSRAGAVPWAWTWYARCVRIGDGMLNSRALCLMLLALCGWPGAGARAQAYAQVIPGVALQFPRDAGSHAQFRTEWWYLTGWVKDASGAERGIQITFFRNRPGVAEANPSRFAPRQLLFAHAALADPGKGKLLHDQRAA